MARIRYPASDKNCEKLLALLQGYILELDPDGNLCLYLKIDASLIEHIFKGCKISLSVDMENKFPSLILEIGDDINNPLYFIDGELEQSQSGFLDHFNHVIQSFKLGREMHLSIFDLNMFPIGCFQLHPQFDVNNWGSWIRSVIRDNTTQATTFRIDLGNKSGKANQRPLALLNLIDSRDVIQHHFSFDYSSADKNGTHGYSQENAIAGVLSRFFRINDNMYVSPQYLDSDNEYTDFIIFLRNTTILIESKFCMSNAPRNINQQLKKASKQLFRAHKSIKQEKNIKSETGKLLTQDLQSRDKVVRLCLLNGNIDVRTRINYLRQLLSKRIKDEETFIMPAFVSTTVLFQFLGVMYEADPTEFESNLEDFLTTQLDRFSKKYKSIPIFDFSK